MDHLTISAFARRVGLTPSSLRFYDDCDVLKPARVDDATGYRYYCPAQEDRAVLLRDLRTAGLPLVEVVAVLDGPPEVAKDVLETHLRRLRQDAGTAEAVVGRVLRELSSPEISVRLGGVELASAVRQVVPSAGSEFPVLGCVLFELADGELRLVATDRYRLAVRVLHPEAMTGSGRFLVPAAALAEIGRWAARFPLLTIESTVIRAAGEARPLPIVDGEFPAYRDILAALAPQHRVIVNRLALREALTDSGPVILRIGTDELTVAETKLPAICAETPLRIGFDPRMLASALETSVGPDVLLEIAGAFQPVIVRSADQGTFTTLVMPVNVEGENS